MTHPLPVRARETPEPSVSEVAVGTPRDDEQRCPEPENVRVLRLGAGANCSSVGSVVDTLFVGAAVGGAIFAAICAAMRDEPVRESAWNTRRNGQTPDERTDDGAAEP